jgi:hypothetical protein
MTPDLFTFREDWPDDPAEQLRRALLVRVLGELCQLRADDVRSPVCPHCAEGPGMALPGGQAFCGNDACDVLLWRVTDEPGAFDAQAQQLVEHTDDAGRITWSPEAPRG